MTSVSKVSRRSTRLSKSSEGVVTIDNSSLVRTSLVDDEAGKKKKTSLVDGKLNFPVRKAAKQLENHIKKTSAIALDSPLYESKGPPASLLRVEISSLSSSSALLDTSRRKHTGLKRTAERAILDADLSQSDLSNVRKISKRNDTNAVAKPSAQRIDSDGFWRFGDPAKEGFIETVELPILSGKTLSTPEDIAVGLEHLKSADPLLKMVIMLHNEGPTFEKRRSSFTSLARSIVFQQLATKAAASIFGRLVNLCEGLDNVIPSTISELSVQQLRDVGISQRKASYLHDLAANFLSGVLSDSSIDSMDDEALMKALTAVKGIGVWSVHMFMLFSLHKPDVLPVGDLGVRKGLQKLYKLKELPTPAESERIALCWRPYRSLGSWYMWRVVNNPLPSTQMD